MEKVFEIYRPLIEGSADRIEWYLEKLVEVGKFEDTLPMLKWGNSPRVKLFSIYGELAEEVEDNDRDRIEDVIGNSKLSEPYVPTLMLWGERVDSQNGKLPPGLSLAEVVSSEQQRSISPELYNGIHEAIQFARSGDNFPKKRLERVKIGAFANIDLIRFYDPTQPIPLTRRLIMELRDHPSLFPPEVMLGGVEVDFRDADDAYRNNYGYLAKDTSQV